MKKKIVIKLFLTILLTVTLLLPAGCGVRETGWKNVADPDITRRSDATAKGEDTAEAARISTDAEEETGSANAAPVPTVAGGLETQEGPAGPGTKPVSGKPAEEAPAGHTHHWVDEIVAVHPAVTHTVHHDAETEQRWVPVISVIQHVYCDVCHRGFASQAEAYAHEQATYQAAIEANDMSLIHAGHYTVEEYLDNGYWQTVKVWEAWDETVVDEPAWEEHIFRCSICGATA